MPLKCFVPGCNSGLPKQNKIYKQQGRKLPSVFHPPENMIDTWNLKIPRADRPLTKKDGVCELHFVSEHIIKYRIFEDTAGNEIKHQLKKVILNPQAIPCIFPNLPSYFNKNIKKRKPPTERSIIPNNRKKNKPSDINAVNETIVNPELVTDITENHLIEPLRYNVHTDAKNIKLPGTMWGLHTDYSEKTVFTHISGFHNDKCIMFTTPNVAKVFIREKETKIEEYIEKRDDIENLLIKTNLLNICSGINLTNTNQWSSKCMLYVESKCVRCNYCKNLSKNINRKKNQQKTTLRTQFKYKRAQQTRRLSKKVYLMKTRINSLKQKFNLIKEEKIDEIIKDLPQTQQEAIKMCFKASLVKSGKGIRYTNNWVYECILMKIKSPALYQKMRREQILPLPSLGTLQRYIKMLEPAYGFQKSTFEMLKEKSKHMDDAERHGCLLLDEMSLSSLVTFNKSTLNIDGLVDLGQFTPEHQVNEMADHALVFMCQPFRGPWIQAIGAFLSKGAAPNNVLQKLIIEATLLLENSGFQVHNIVTDGGPWNRGMWNAFGVTNTNFSCEHPVEPSRKLWFMSDFPHLIKTMWTRVIKDKTFECPDGIVKFEHWKYLVEYDDSNHIKLCYKLTRDHLYPQHFQKMNVKMAMVFFSKSVADCMQELMNRGYEKFKDCGPTISFIRKINDLVDIMNSNTKKHGLQADKNSYSNKIIVDFIDYLNKWKSDIPDQNFRFTSQTEKGLIVSLNSTLQLVEYLCTNVNDYHYLMTKRINQDKIEHLFGCLRQACGSNQNPDPKQFIQVYRLLSCYSLIKPPRGSNVSGGEMLNSLVNIQHSSKEDKQHKLNLEKKLDELLDNGDFEIFNDHLYCEDQITSYIDKPALTYFVGYVARNAKKHSLAKTCNDCFNSLISTSDDHTNLEVEVQEFINMRNRGHLLSPSECLMNLIYCLETAIINVINNKSISRHILEHVMDEVNITGVPSKVGCLEHQNELTKYIINFYLNTRMIFACKRHNDQISYKKNTIKRLKKISKLI